MQYYRSDLKHSRQHPVRSETAFPLYRYEKRPHIRDQAKTSPSLPDSRRHIHLRTLNRWVLPPGVAADKKVTLRFRLDAAGSASSVSVVRAEDNSLGASAVDALRSASPFPPMPETVRCLTRVPIVGTFSNPVAG